MTHESIEATVWIIAILSAFFSPAVLVATVLRHRERMAALKQRVDGAPTLVAELQKLHSEMAQLRDTTTHYDMSFDAALQRVEARIESVEQGATANRYPAYGGVTVGTTAEDQTILRRH